MSLYDSDAEVDAEFPNSIAGFSGTPTSLPELPLTEFPGDFPLNDRILLDSDLDFEEFLHSQSPKNTPNLTHDDKDEHEENDDNNDDNDDGLHAEELLSLLDDGSFGDDEEVDVAADLHTWKINHNKGQHKLRGESFDHSENSYEAC
jgi:hypothetical protein